MNDTKVTKSLGKDHYLSIFNTQKGHAKHHEVTIIPWVLRENIKIKIQMNNLRLILENLHCITFISVWSIFRE